VISPLKILCTGDWHCGDVAGLTPPSQWKRSGPIFDLQKQLWDWFVSTLEAFGPFDMTLFTGDMVEGEGKKGTIELYETNTEVQAEIAVECAQVIKCDKKNMRTVYGTPFHTAGSYSYENHFCDTLGIQRPKTTRRINIADRVRVNLRHTVGRSNIPYGQGTPTYKEMVNEMISAIRQDDVSADITLRGHAHYSVDIKVGNKESVVVPCMKYPGSVFGRKLQESEYHMGIGVLYVYGFRDWLYRPVLLPLQLSNSREWEEWNSENQL